MRFFYEQPCPCGGAYLFEACGDNDWKPVECSNCGETANLMNPLSVSVTADRLLHRSKSELENGDFTFSILASAIAVETFLTRLYLKFQAMETKAYNSPPDLEKVWKERPPKAGGFPRSGGFLKPADFVSNAFTGKSFDEFSQSDPHAAKILASLPIPAQTVPSTYFQNELFKRRNEIAHWGYVNSSQSEAQLCLTAAIAIVGILKMMDCQKYGNL